MDKFFDTERNAPVKAPGLDPTYKPAIDGHAKRLIARIQKDNRDTEAVVQLEAHYRAHRDYPSLANLMEGWAHTLRDDRRAAAGVREGRRSRARGPGRSRARRSPCSSARSSAARTMRPRCSRLEALLREQGDDTGFERCLSQIIAELERRGAAPQVRAHAHYKLGQLYEERLLLRGRAIAQYRTAVELDPTLVPAIAAARGIYLNSGKMEAAADMFELQIAAMTGGDRSPRAARRARHATAAKRSATSTARCSRCGARSSSYRPSRPRSRCSPRC